MKFKVGDKVKIKKTDSVSKIIINNEGLRGIVISIHNNFRNKIYKVRFNGGNRANGKKRDGEWIYNCFFRELRKTKWIKL